jgi:putative membrane protein
MYVNHLTLSLMAVTGVLLLGAWYVLRGEAREDERKAYAFAFGAGGLIMTITGLSLALAWPLPGQFNVAFGDPLAYFGVLLSLGAIALGRGVDLRPLAALGALGGAGSVLVAIAVARYRLTMIPGLATAAFGASGLAALLFPLRLRFKAARIVTGALLGVAGVLFAIITATAILHHLAPGSFDAWKPAPMRGLDALFSSSSRP